jgi:NADH-quinone oxidoreductase subunit J
MTDTIFYAVAAVTLGSALYVAISGNIVRSAFMLLVTLSGVAAIFALLGADLIAGLQILIYAGGVLILILFAILLTEGISIDPSRSNPLRREWLALLVPLFLTAFWIVLLINTPLPEIPSEVKPLTDLTGEQLLTQFVLPFELISFLLLAGVIGSVYIMKRSEMEGAKEPNGSGGA